MILMTLNKSYSLSPSSSPWSKVVVHGIPDVRVFRSGDLVTIDISVFVNGFHGDKAASFLLGRRGVIDFDRCDLGHVDVEAVRLLKVTRCCLEEAIKICRSGVTLSSIGELIEEIAYQNSLAVIPAVCGHSIGEYFHGPPDIVHARLEEYESTDGQCRDSGILNRQ